MRETDGGGREIVRQRSYVELAGGLNYLDEKGDWNPTREEFRITPEGFAVAEFGPVKLIVANNLNAPDALDILTADGVRLRLAPLAIGYYDPTDGRTLMMALVKDCPGTLTAPNEITFRDAFDDLAGSIRITYRRSGITSDLILHEAPPDPVLFGFSDRTRIELYHELTPDSPAPAATGRVLKRENDPLARQAMVEPDFTDHLLDFGQYKMGSGTAFHWDGQPQSPGIPVAKSFHEVDGRKLLVEAIEWQDAVSLLAALPKVEGEQFNQQQLMAKVRSFPDRAFPVRQASIGNVELIRQDYAHVGSKDNLDLALLLDWSLVTGPTNFLFRGDTTYFVTSGTYLYTNTFAGNTVVKFTNGASLNLEGPVQCDTGPYRPATFTAWCDNSIGETLPQSTGNPTGYGGAGGGSRINDWRYETFQGDYANATSVGRVWDGGPSGRRNRGDPTQQIDDACPYEDGSGLPSTPAASNNGGAINRLVAASLANGNILLRWSRIASIPSVTMYSPKQYDGFALNVEGIAYQSPTEMIIGLRSPLNATRGTGNTLYFHVNNVANFLPVGGWTANTVAAGVLGPLNFDLGGQGVRDIGWFSNLGLDGSGNPVARYLIIGGPANGGPLEKENVDEVFSLWSWQGPGGPAPVRIIPDLRPYTVRPEGLTMIQLNGQSRLLFAEDRFRATGYGTRNAIHWPMSILGDPANL